MTGSALVQRIAVGVVAVAAIVWLAVSIADMDALATARKRSSVLLQPHAPARAHAAALRDALAATRRAEDLRPGDQGPLTARAYIYAFAGRSRRALAEAERLARPEPRNRATRPAAGPPRTSNA